MHVSVCINKITTKNVIADCKQNMDVIRALNNNIIKVIKLTKYDHDSECNIPQLGTDLFFHVREGSEVNKVR